jgi:hypothetical protein
MDIRERDTLKHRIETLGAEVDALRLLVLTLIGRMAIDDADQIKAVAQMVEAAGEALHSAEGTTLHHQAMAREIDSISSLMQQVIHVPRHH